MKLVVRLYKRYPKLAAAGLLVLSLIAVAVIGWQFRIGPNPDLGAIAGMACVTAIALLVALLLPLAFTTWHELGHLVAGWMAGLRLNRIVIGQLQWDVRQGRVSFSQSATSWLRGYVWMTQDRGVPDRWRMAVHVLGGPIFTLIPLLAISIWLAGRVSPDQSDRYLHDLIWIAFTFVAVVILLPFSDGYIESDGRLLQRIAFDWPKMQRGLALSQLRALAADLVPAEQWSDGLLDEVCSDPSDIETFGPGLIYRYYKAMLAGDVSAARLHLEEALAAISIASGWFMVIRCQAAIFFGFNDRDAARAGDALNSISVAHYGDRYDYQMAVAATRLAQNRHNETLVAIDRAIELSKNGSESVYPVEQDLMQGIRKAAQEISDAKIPQQP